MKAWKEEIVKELEKQTEDLREISFKDTVVNMGYKHIKHEDIRDIAHAFINRNPDYKAVNFIEEKSLFNGLVFTELDYSDSDVEEKIRKFFGSDIDNVNIKNGIVEFYLVNGVRYKEIDEEQRKGDAYHFQFDFYRMRRRYTNHKFNFYWTPWQRFKLEE